MIWVRSRPVERPKSSTFSSVESGGVLLKPSRLRKMGRGERTRGGCLVWGIRGGETKRAGGERTRWRRLVRGIRGRKTNRARVCVHQSALRAVSSRVKKAAR